MIYKDLKFAVKAEDEGVFRGLAAAYGNTDLGGDVIAPGAFTKTTKEKDGQVPVLWQHDTFRPIGLGQVEDTKKGLQIEGRLVMETEQAREAFALMKAGVVKGLSIGYDPVVTEFDRESDTRILKEIKLWEVSPVTFPMNPRAVITGVKGISDELAALLARFEDELRGLKDARELSPAARASLARLSEKVLALLAQTEAAASRTSADPAAAPHHIGAPELHALTNLLHQEMQSWN